MAALSTSYTRVHTCAVLTHGRDAAGARPPPKYRLFVLVFVAVYTLIVVASYTSTPALSSALDSKNKPGFTAVVVLITVLTVVSLVVFLMVPLLRMLPGVNAWFTSPYRASWGDGPVARFGYWLLVG